MMNRRDALKYLGCLCAFLISRPAFAAHAQGSSMLIAYFSWGGNTAKVAEIIRSMTGAELLRIETVQPYPRGYSEVVEIAKKERAANARPELKDDFPVGMDKFKVVFLGYPVWDYTMPMPVYSFLDRFKFAGAEIAPFSTHLGSGLADGPEQIAKLCPKARILPALAIRGNMIGECAPKVQAWLEELKLIR